MGSLCSKLSLPSLCSRSSTHTSDHAVISDIGGSEGSSVDRRNAAAAAAERRLKEGIKRGVVTTNPNSGTLTHKLVEQKKGNATEVEPPHRFIYD